jgi:thermitase
MITPADYPDPRDEARRRRDADAASQQSAALTSANRDPGARADGLIDQLLARRQGVRSDPPPLQIDVLRLPGPDHGDRGGTYLVVRGELLLRVPPDAPPGPEHADADRSKGDPPPYQQAEALLERRGFLPQVTRVFRRGVLPVRTFKTKDPNVHELVRTRQLVRDETGADVDFNYVCTTGYLTKGEDYPVPTAGLTWYPPQWFEQHPPLRAINVAIIDTGINRELRTDGWLQTIDEDAQNEDFLDVVPGDGVLAESGGHGTFVSGIVQQIAPESTITVYRAMDSEGMGPVDLVGSAIVQAAADGANIINLSLGTPAVNHQPPLPLTAALDTLQADYPGVIVVASAGNNGDATPVYPAAMDGVVAVGALKPDMLPVGWSSFGPWVDCSAIGVGVSSTFVEGDEVHADGTIQVFGPDAWAIWSGTSFSAAQITGAVAMLCQLDDLDPADALALLLDGQPTLADYGVLLQILPGS